MKRLRSTSLAYLLLVLTAIVVPLFASDLLSGMPLLQQMIVSEVLYVAVALLVVWLMDRQLIGQIQQAGMRVQVILLIVLIGILIQPVTTWLNLFSMMFVKNYVAGTMMETASGSVLFNLLYIAVAPAVAEEFIYRGLLYHGYRQLGVMKAACLSGLLFGLMHMNWNQFVYAFALGVILALIVEASGSIYSSMMIHFMINARSVLLMAAYAAVYGTSVTAASTQLSQGAGLRAVLLYTPIALGCAVGIFFAVRRIAALCGRRDFFDLAMQGQEQSVKSRTSGSERDVRETEEKMRRSAGEVLQEDAPFDAQAEQEKGCPAEHVARYASSQCEEWEQASVRERILVMLPAIIGAVLCIGYMFWIEIF